MYTEGNLPSVYCFLRSFFLCLGNKCFKHGNTVLFGQSERIVDNDEISCSS